MPVNESVVDAVTAANFKSIAEAGAIATNLSVQNAVAHQQSMNQISAAATGKVVETLVTTDVAESAGLSALVHQLAKIAQTTPPPTA